MTVGRVREILEAYPDDMEIFDSLHNPLDTIEWIAPGEGDATKGVIILHFKEWRHERMD